MTRKNIFILFFFTGTHIIIFTGSTVVLLGLFVLSIGTTKLCLVAVMFEET